VVSALSAGEIVNLSKSQQYTLYDDADQSFQLIVPFRVSLLVRIGFSTADLYDPAWVLVLGK